LTTEPNSPGQVALGDRRNTLSKHAQNPCALYLFATRVGEDRGVISISLKYAHEVGSLNEAPRMRDLFTNQKWANSGTPLESFLDGGEVVRGDKTSNRKWLVYGVCGPKVVGVYISPGYRPPTGIISGS